MELLHSELLGDIDAEFSQHYMLYGSNYESAKEFDKGMHTTEIFGTNAENSVQKCFTYMMH